MSIALTVSVIDGEPRVDSRLVAAELDVAHQQTRELVDKYSSQFEELGILRFETGEIKGRGQPEKFYLLNEDQTYFLMTLVRNTAQAVELKKRLSLDDRKILRSQLNTNRIVSNPLSQGRQ